VVLLDEALEFVKELDVVEIKTLFKGAQGVFGGLQEVVVGDKKVRGCEHVLSRVQ